MAKFIIAKIVDTKNKTNGFRVYDTNEKDFKDLNFNQVFEYLKREDPNTDLNITDKGIIVNASLKDGDIEVDNFGNKEIIIDEKGNLISYEEYLVCGCSSSSCKIYISRYNGEFNEFSLSKSLEFIESIGEDKFTNLDAISLIKKAFKKKEVKSVCKSENIELNSKNPLINKILAEVNKNKKDIVGAFILNTKMKADNKNLRYYEYDSEGKQVLKTNFMDLDVNDTVVSTFFLLKTASKKFITLPACKELEEVINSFEYSDITIENFKDFIDFLADRYDDLEYSDEKIISQILGSTIDSVIIDNTKGATFEIVDNNIEIDDENIELNLTVEVKEGYKKTKTLTVLNFPWVLF